MLGNAYLQKSNTLVVACKKLEGEDREGESSDKFLTSSRPRRWVHHFTQLDTTQQNIYTLILRSRIKAEDGWNRERESVVSIYYLV